MLTFLVSCRVIAAPRFRRCNSNVSGLARQSIDRQLEQFRAVYGHSGSDVQALQEWMQTYYRRPRPDLLLGAWAVAAGTPGALTSDAAFPGAVFLSHVLRNFQHPKVLSNTIEALTLASSVCEPDGLVLNLRSADLMETLFRAMYLAQHPVFDAALESMSSRWVQSIKGGGDSGTEDDPELANLAKSLFPPSGERVRVPLLEWPIPALGLSVFELHVTRSPFPVYAVSRYLFSGTHAAYTLAKQGDRMRLALLLPALATVVTCSMTDALWAEFYATGNPKAVLRVLDIGTPYMDFVEEYGVEPVTGYNKEAASRGVRAAVTLTSGWGAATLGLPEEFLHDPYNRMRFETSRYALWTLLVNASTHTVVGDTLLRHTAATQDRVAMFGPLGANEEGVMTAHGKMQLALLKALLPSFASLRTHAENAGIGSGQWPTSYPLLGKSTVPQLEDATSGLHTLQATTSEAVSLPVTKEEEASTKGVRE